MSKIEIKKCVYYIYPIYDLYAADENGNIMNIVKKIPMKGTKHNTGYKTYVVKKHAQKGQKSCQVHRFVWECFNGIIPEGKVIDHNNNDKGDNRICSLQLMTQQENCKKSAKKS